MSRAISVIHVITSLESGGAERALLELVREQAHLRPLIATLWPGGELLQGLRSSGIPVVALGRVKRPRFSVLFLAARLAFLARKSGGLLHAHMWHSDLLCRLVGALLRAPVVSTTQLAHASRARILADRWSLRWLSARICVSGDVAGFVRREIGGDPWVIPNSRRPVRPFEKCVARTILGLGRGPAVGVLARLHDQKDPRLFCSCVEALRRRFPDIQAVWIGEGPTAWKFQSALSESGVIPFGHHPEGSRLLSALDAVVFCSRWEGFPMALIEAWSAGVPVVATAVPGLLGTVHHEETGLLSSRNTSDLAAAVTAILERPELGRRLVRAGRLEAAKHNPALVARETEKLYREVLGFREANPPSCPGVGWSEAAVIEAENLLERL